VFGSAAGSGLAAPAVDLKSLHAKIGELTLENDFLGGALSKACHPQKFNDTLSAERVMRLVSLLPLKSSLRFLAVRQVRVLAQARQQQILH
jgi:hypothetical protein